MSGPTLVTGATGFVGAHVARRLVAEGVDTHVLCRADDPAALRRLDRVRQSVTTHVADLAEPRTIRAVVERLRPRRILHFAAATMHAGVAPDARTQVAVNLLGTATLMGAARDVGVEAFVNIGDAFEYGPGDGAVTEKTPPRPQSADGVTKLAATLYGRSLARDVGLPVVTLRLFSVVGPDDDPRRLVPLLVERVATGAPIALSDRRVVRDFVWIDDVVDLTLRVAEAASRLRGQVLNCGSGRATTLADLIAALADVSGRALEARWGEFPVAEHDLHHPVADVSAAAIAVGWRPTTPLDDMLAALLADQPSGPGSAPGPGRSR